MKILEGKIPTVAGFYFAKSETSNKWQLLIKVSGVAPFMNMDNIHCLNQESDDTILQNLLTVEWSEAVEMTATTLDVHCGFTISMETKDSIINKLIDGQKLAAVILLKKSTDNEMGLKEAKNYVDALEVTLKDSGVLQRK
jgi:hypothetical protein